METGESFHSQLWRIITGSYRVPFNVKAKETLVPSANQILFLYGLPENLKLSLESLLSRDGIFELHFKSRFLGIK
jgi:hypothetical protein